MGLEWVTNKWGVSGKNREEDGAESREQRKEST
jgi:hypothetical protein